MPLSNKQISSLLGMIASTEQDDLDCDSCFDHLAEFAENELANREVPEAMKAVEVHLRQCPCCKDEYKALLDGLSALNQDG